MVKTVLSNCFKYKQTLGLMVGDLDLYLKILI